jgi:hypothetical protein
MTDVVEIKTVQVMNVSTEALDRHRAEAVRRGYGSSDAAVLRMALRALDESNPESPAERSPDSKP